MIEQIANILLICLELLPIQGEPFACVRHSPHQLISGRVRPVPRSLMRLRGLGLQGGWDHSLPRRRSAMSKSGHTSTLDFI